MKFVQSVIAVLVAVNMLSCASATKYQRRGNGMFDNYGYIDSQLDSINYTVVFIANEHTPSTVVERYALYRAAELTSEHGYDYFVVLNHGGPDGSPSSDLEIGVTSRIGGEGSPQGNGYTSSTSILMNTKSIRMFKGPKPADDPNAIDVKAMLRDVGPSIQR